MGIDPSHLHLKKELTQIRKAARVLRDPGTSSARSHHYVHHQGNATASSSDHLLQLPLKVESSDSFSKGVKGVAAGDKNEKDKERRVFLYNWRYQKSEGEDDVETSSTRDESLNVCVNDSKSDGYLSDGYSSAILKYHNSNFSPSIKKKSKGSNYSSASSRYHKEKLQMKMLLSRYTKNVVDGLPSLRLGRDDLVDDYCHSEDLTRESAISPLLVRLNYKRWSRSPTKKEEDSVSNSTQALSSSSYAIGNPSTVESWDCITGSLNGADDELDLPGRQRCGIPCYWSRRSTPKSRTGSSCSPSLSDTLRRKGSSMFCGTQSRHHHLPSGSSKRRSTAAQSLIPLVDNGSGTHSDDELSMNFAELDLEALSRLDGRRWSSSCRSQEGSAALNEEASENMRSPSHKYRPVFFDELIGQNIVVQSLTSAVSGGRIWPVYLFQGPRGTGKTSTARIFTAALNCLATKETKPCGVCMECADFISGKNRYLEEIDGSNKKGIDQLKNLPKKISVLHSLARPCYKVFVIDQCHLLPSKTWLAFLQILDKQFPHVVFILISTDIDNVPHTILTRCQKHLFNKISKGDIVARLRKICIDENLDVESNALELIALNADGSLGDAETTLDQLSLFGKRITKSLVNELMGVVSDEKLLDLLELAMSSNAMETVLRARELMDSGADPIALVSQLVTLIVDIIAGTYPIIDAKHNDLLFGGRTLSERELERLKHALALLSEAEKHLRVSSERSTWFTATLLQLGSVSSPDPPQSINSRRQSEEDLPTASKQRTDALFASENLGEQLTVSHDDTTGGNTTLALTCMDSKMLTKIWLQCIDKCHSKTLRQLLHSFGKLVSITEIKGGFVAHIAFEDSNIKSRAEGFLSSITNSFEVVLRCNVEVNIIQDTLVVGHNPMCENKSIQSNKTGGGSSDLDLCQGSLKIRCEGHQSKCRDAKSEDGKSESDVPLRRIESIIHEQRLESAWLQAEDKGTHQGNQDHPNRMEPINYVEDHQSKVDGMTHQKLDHCPISPSLLHSGTSANNISKDNVGYESGSGGCGCSGLFCWKNRKPHRRGKGKQGS